VTLDDAEYQRAWSSAFLKSLSPEVFATVERLTAQIAMDRAAAKAENAKLAEALRRSNQWIASFVAVVEWLVEGPVPPSMGDAGRSACALLDAYRRSETIPTESVEHQP
jgi:hypothetical protein